MKRTQTNNKKEKNVTSAIGKNKKDASDLSIANNAATNKKKYPYRSEKDKQYNSQPEFIEPFPNRKKRT